MFGARTLVETQILAVLLGKRDRPYFVGVVEEVVHRQNVGNRPGEDVRAATAVLVVRQHRGRQPHRQAGVAALHQIPGFAVMSAGLDDDCVGPGEPHDLTGRERSGHGPKPIPCNAGCLRFGR